MTEVSEVDVADLVSASGGGVWVRPAAYTNPAIFDAEMRRVFESGWVYLAHESEVPTAGDYKTGVIGVQPFVVTRHEDGEIYALLNRCRHRGMVVCRAAAGHSHYLRCAYHNWTYSGDGTLIGVAQASGYPDDFDKSVLGLQAVTQVGVYRGFIFGNLSVDGPTLEEHLAAVRPGLDASLSRSPVGTVTLLPSARKMSCPGNWKRHAEQAHRADQGVFVFPNVCLFDDEVSVITPVDAGLTEISSYRYLLDGSPKPDEPVPSREYALEPRHVEDTADGEYFDQTPMTSFYREWKRRMMS